jgi:hypothetical protein
VKTPAILATIAANFSLLYLFGSKRLTRIVAIIITAYRAPALVEFTFEYVTFSALQLTAKTSRPLPGYWNLTKYSTDLKVQRYTRSYTGSRMDWCVHRP